MQPVILSRSCRRCGSKAAVGLSLSDPNRTRRQSYTLHTKSRPRNLDSSALTTLRENKAPQMLFRTYPFRYLSADLKSPYFLMEPSLSQPFQRADGNSVKAPTLQNKCVFQFETQLPKRLESAVQKRVNCTGKVVF